MLRHFARLILVTCAIALPNVSAAAQEGRFATGLPPGNPVVKDGAVPFIKRIEKDTGGALTYRVFSGGSLLGMKNIVTGLRDGVADIGQIVFGYFPAEFPHSALVADMAMYGSNPAAVAAAATEFSLTRCPACLSEFKKQGLVSLGTTSTSEYIILARQDLSAPDALRGKKLRTPGAVWDRWSTSVGAIPVNIPASEIYESLTRGQVDAVLQPAGALQTYSLYETARNVTTVSLGTYPAWGIFCVGANHWRALSTDQRAALLRSALRGVIQAAVAYVTTDKAALETARSKGAAIRPPTPELLQQLNNFRAADRKTIVATAKDKYKIADPDPLIDEYTALLKKWEAAFQPLGLDTDKMAEMLTQAVLPKLDPSKFGL